MSAILKLEPYLEAVSILPGNCLRVTLPSGTCVHFQYEPVRGTWREFLAIPSEGAITGGERQEAFELLRGFFEALF